jgi:membrane-associated phospholipid phosphatase
MIRIRSTIACALLLVATQRASAQSVGRMVLYDVGHAGGDIIGTWAAPFHSTVRDWLGAGAVLAVSAAVSPLDDDIDRWFLNHQTSSAWSSLKEFREGGKAFAGNTITPVAAGLYVIGLVTKSKGIRDGVWGCVASYASESVVRSQVMYRLVGRLRPDSLRSAHVATPSNQGDQYKFYFPGSNAWGKHSAPAGHVANMAACASFLSHRFDNPYVTIPAYAVTLAVGVGREVDRRHWTSDTVLGVLFGYAVGKEVALRSRERARDDAAHGGGTDDGGSMFFAPTGDGLVVGWQRSF